MIDLRNLVTEKRNTLSNHLDQMSSLEIVTLMNQEDDNVVKAVRDNLPMIGRLVEVCINVFSNTGRIIYIGAGTSGRIGVLDAVECLPTFGVGRDKVVGVIAGGDKAFTIAVEGAEDDIVLGKTNLEELSLTRQDVVIGIAASGRTPYVIGALEYANEIGAKTGCIVCNRDSEIGKIVEYPIEIAVGPEVLTGSTRLKSGTAQKMVCNMISTATMVGVGKVHQNLMVDIVTTNKKLEVRALNMVMDITNCKEEDARRALEEANGSVKVAIVSLLLHCDIATANNRLQEADGHVRNALL